VDNLKKKIEKTRDLLREETNQRDKLLAHAKLQRNLMKNLKTQTEE
jgi:hypothetical protein